MDRTVTRNVTAAVVLAVNLAASQAMAAGDAANGKTLFARCAVCHKVVQGSNGIDYWPGVTYLVPGVTVRLSLPDTTSGTAYLS